MKFKKGDVAIQINCPISERFVYITGIGLGTKELPSYYHKHYCLCSRTLRPGWGLARESLLVEPTEDELNELRLMVAL